MSEPVFVIDASRWPRTLARLRQLGELDEDDARHDLRYLENEHRVWMKTNGRRGSQFPGRRVLADRWGWTERQARYLLEADDWHDPLNPVSAEDLRARFVQRPASVPPSVPPPSRERPATQQTNADNAAESSRECPATVPPSVPQTSIARAPSENHDQPHNHPPADAGPDVQGLWKALVQFTGKPNGWKLTEPRRKAIRARVKDHDLATVERVIAWVNTSNHDRARFLRERGDPDTVLRQSNFDTYAGFSQSMAPPSSIPATVNAPTVALLDDGNRAWTDLLALADGGGYHRYNPPRALDAVNEARDHRMRRALSDAGGWIAFCARDRFTEPAMRQAFVTTYDRLALPVAS